MHSDNSKGAAHPAVTSKGSASTAPAAEYLTFQLGQEEYGIDILKVQEIRSYETPTRMAQAPSFIKGIIDLRGVIVPIIDLRLKLQCASAEYTAPVPVPTRCRLCHRHCPHGRAYVDHDGH